MNFCSVSRASSKTRIVTISDHLLPVPPRWERLLELRSSPEEKREMDGQIGTRALYEEPRPDAAT